MTEGAGLLALLMSFDSEDVLLVKNLTDVFFLLSHLLVLPLSGLELCVALFDKVF